MIVILAILLALSRLEEEVTSGHLEDHAGEGPEVGTGPILGAYDDFRRAVLPRLDLRREVMIGPAAVAQVTNLQLKVLTKLGPATLRPVFLNLMLDLPWVEQVKLQIWNAQHLAKLIIAALLVLRDRISASLTLRFRLFKLLDLGLDAHLLALLELLAILEELVKLAALTLVLVPIEAEEGGRCNACFLHLLHLLEKKLTLHIVSLFEGLGSQIGTREVLHARFRHIPRHFLELIQFLVEDAHLALIKPLEVPLGRFLVRLALKCRVLLADLVQPAGGRLVLPGQVRPALLLKLGSLRPQILGILVFLLLCFSLLLLFRLLERSQFLLSLSLLLSALLSGTFGGFVEDGRLVVLFLLSASAVGVHLLVISRCGDWGLLDFVDLAGTDLLEVLWQLEHLCSRQLAPRGYLFHFLLGEAEVDVLWLEISVDDLADAVQVIETHQALLRHYADKRQRDALVVVPLNDFKQVDAKNLEDHHKVLTVRTMVQEAVEKLDAMAVVTCDIFKLFGLLGVILFERVEPFWFHPVAGDLIKDFDLVKGGNEVVAC